ncbi:glycosyltransferase [Celeribacter neptunius]|uniref:Glycosyltransferase Family 4 n=1 Tax=Celeribacter neptunius TaxID=588602 RepID=A0A1I3THK3_9RHOB|nr:glycosyltransferase [Celeribacter neptunius]SFJ69096.1 Glycosyltransferase Family 4 [Celeribacter neptunius]
MPQTLLLTNHLFQWSGSETIIIELAEALTKRGHKVTIFANEVSDLIVSPLKDTGISIATKSNDIAIADFDIVYCQHQILSQFADQLISLEAKQELPKVIYAHLSPFFPLEKPGPVVEPRFADVILCNSEETINSLKELGISDARVRIFPNPAPDEFYKEPVTGNPPRKILAISNHFPNEVIRALDKLEANGFQVTRRGIEYKNQRVTPNEVIENDLILSIGKSVQYAIAAGRPPYVYDYFGGPGWLNSENFKNAAKFNFSGRCCGRKVNAETIFDEIVNGYTDAVAELKSFSNARESFRLENYLNEYFEDDRKFLTAPKSTIGERKVFDDNACLREQAMAQSLPVLPRSAAHVDVDHVMIDFFSRNRCAYILLWLSSRIGKREHRGPLRMTYRIARKRRKS